MNFFQNLMQAIRKPAGSATILVRSASTGGQAWWRATMISAQDDTLFLSGVNTNRDAVLGKAKKWCKDNGFAVGKVTVAA
jgi:hypothetical protein